MVGGSAFGYGRAFDLLLISQGISRWKKVCMKSEMLIAFLLIGQKIPSSMAGTPTLAPNSYNFKIYLIL